jgi:hypothetical protein
MNDDALYELLQQARELNAKASGGNVNFSVNAGGVGVWVAVAACGFMVALNIGLAVLLVRQDREISEMGHQLNAIYMMAPHLKPEVTP